MNNETTSDNQLSVIQIESPLQVDTESLQQAAYQYQQVADWLTSLRTTLGLVTSSPTIFGNLIATEVAHLWGTLQALTEKTQQLYRRLTHAQILYEAVEDANIRGFSHGRGTSIQQLLQQMKPAIFISVTAADVLGRTYRKFVFRQVTKTLHLQGKPSSYLIFALIDFSLLQLASDAKTAYEEVKKADTWFLRYSNSQVEKIAARIARMNLERQAANQTFLPYLHVNPVTADGQLYTGVELNRWDIMLGETNIPQTVTAQSQAVGAQSRAVGAQGQTEWNVPVVGEITTPLTVSTLLQRTKTVRDKPLAKTASHKFNEKPRSGEVEIIRHSTRQPDGQVTRSYTIVFKGTQDFSLDATTSHDMQTNLQAMASLRNDMSASAQAGLEMLGAQPGEAVELVGHSQGGIVSAELAGEAAFAQRYQVTGVITAGSPVAESNLAEGLPVVSFEHLDDPVAALDTKMNPNSTRRLNYSVNGELANPPGNATGLVDHSLEGYITAAQQVEAQPERSLREWLRTRRELMHLSKETRSEVFRFAVTRKK